MAQSSSKSISIELVSRDSAFHGAKSADICGLVAMKIAKERKSSVLASNAVHHRIDSLTSIVALVAIVGSHVLHNISWLDPVGGLLVSMMVIKAGWGNTANALLELSDVGVAADIKDSVRRAAQKALSENALGSGKFAGSQVDVREVQGIKAGQNYLMSLELGVPGNWSVDETGIVEDTVRNSVSSRVRGIRRVRVRFVANADNRPSFTDEFISTDVSPRISPEPDEGIHCEHTHNHIHDQAQGKTPNGDVRRRR